MSHFISFATRWLARSAALFITGVFLFLVSGEVLHAHSGPPTQVREWAGIVLLTAAIVSALLAWKWELPGALASLATLAAFVPTAGMRNYDVVAVLAIPGGLFVFDWILRHRGGHAEPRSLV
jgi:hypothetical protein